MDTDNCTRIDAHAANEESENIGALFLTGKVVTCEHLARALWGNAAENKLHELQVLIARVRQKLEADKERIMIRTVDRIGYQLVFESTPQANIAVQESCRLNAAVA